VSDPVTYTAVLPIGESTVAFVSGLLSGERARAVGPGVVAARWVATGIGAVTAAALVLLHHQHGRTT
jgi:hypothetical protein